MNGSFHSDEFEEEILIALHSPKTQERTQNTRSPFSSQLSPSIAQSSEIVGNGVGNRSTDRTPEKETGRSANKSEVSYSSLFSSEISQGGAQLKKESSLPRFPPSDKRRINDPNEKDFTTLYEDPYSSNIVITNSTRNTYEEDVLDFLYLTGFNLTEGELEEEKRELQDMDLPSATLSGAYEQLAPYRFEFQELPASDRSASMENSFQEESEGGDEEDACDSNDSDSSGSGGSDSNEDLRLGFRSMQYMQSRAGIVASTLLSEASGPSESFRSESSHVSHSRSPEFSLNAALWPRQPNQFAFSQEDNETTNDSDEAYSEEIDGEDTDVELRLRDVDHHSKDDSDHMFPMDDDDDNSDEDDSDNRGSLEGIGSDEYRHSHNAYEPLERSPFSINSSRSPKRKVGSKIPSRYKTMELRVVFEDRRTGFEPTKEFEGQEGFMIGNRYKVIKCIGEAAFSKAFECIDLETMEYVCTKVIRNNKEFFDQGLDEIRILKYIKEFGDPDQYNILQMYDYFYFKEHLIIVTELLKENLYEYSKLSAEESQLDDIEGEYYFNMDRIRIIARQCLEGLSFIHSIELIHCDLKPENIVLQSCEDATIKIIDFGSSCYTSDELTTYIQSRSYRAPEVILGLQYNSKIDMWSLGCILAELYLGEVLFPNESAVTLIAKIIETIGPIPPYMIEENRDESQKFFTDDHQLFSEGFDGEISLVFPTRSSLKRRLETEDDQFLDFLSHLLRLDPSKRIGADDALKHPWMR